MSIPVFCYFQTGNGKLIARAKNSQEDILPLSCYYDHVDVIAPVRHKLKEDVFPILRFIEKEIGRNFEIAVSELLYTAWMKVLPSVKGLTLHQIEEMADKFLDEYDVENFELIINIEVAKNELKWRTQLSVNIDKITWQDLDLSEDYPVWVLFFQGVSQPVDLLFSTEQSTEIVTDIIGHLISGYNEELSRLKGKNIQVELTEIFEGFGDDEHSIWHLNNGAEIIEINRVFEDTSRKCTWIGTDKKFVEVMYSDWDSLELFAIMNLKGEIIIKGLRNIENYIESEQIFIVEITGRAIEAESIYYDLPYDEWRMAVIDAYGNFIIPPSYSSILFDEQTQTLIGNNYAGTKDRYSLNGELINC